MSDASLKIYAIYRDEGEDVVFFIARSFWLLTLKRISELSLIFDQTFHPLCDLVKPYGEQGWMGFKGVSGFSHPRPKWQLDCLDPGIPSPNC